MKARLEEGKLTLESSREKQLCGLGKRNGRMRIHLRNISQVKEIRKMSSRKAQERKTGERLGFQPAINPGGP